MAITNLTNTHWKLNETLVYTETTDLTAVINFTSNGGNATQMIVMDGGNLVMLDYVGIGTAYQNGWIAPIYREIHITGGTDTSNTTFITWLSNNAVQLEEKPILKELAFQDKIPTKTSQLTNDSGFTTKTYVDGEVAKKADKTYVDSEVAKKANTTYVDAENAKKQDTLVSGTNIKTINDTSILGSGNIEIKGGGGIEIVDVLPTPNYQLFLEGKFYLNGLSLYTITESYKSTVSAGEVFGINLKPYIYFSGEVYDTDSRDEYKIILTIEKDGITRKVISNIYNDWGLQESSATIYITNPQKEFLSNTTGTITYSSPQELNDILNGSKVVSYTEEHNYEVDSGIFSGMQFTYYEMTEIAWDRNIPTKTSDLTNDSNFTNKAYVDTQDSDLQAQINAIKGGYRSIVSTKSALDSLDKSNYNTNDIVKVISDETRNNTSTYYQLSSSKVWVYIATDTDKGTIVTVGGVEQASWSADNKVDKVSGKGLSTNDYTNEDKLQVSHIADKADRATTYSKTETDSAITSAIGTALITEV